MADDLDKFVLEYKVDTKDSVGRLEKLNDKMGNVQRTSKDAGKELRQFGADAASELGKLVPGLNAVGQAVRAMGAEFAVAGAAIAVLAVGVKSVIDMRDQFNSQRSSGMQIGVSGARVENWQRQFVRAGGGYVTRGSALEGIQQFSEMSNAAYQDPTRVGREARLLRMVGVDVGARGATPTGMTDRLTQLATYLQGKSPGMVQGVAKTMGVNQDWLLALQRLGPSVGKITEMTNAQVDQYEKGSDTLSKFNAELATFNEDMNELEMKLGGKVLPAMDKFIVFLTKMTDLFNKATDPSTPSGNGYKIVNGHRVNNTPAAPASGDARHGHFGPGHTWIEDPLSPADAAKAGSANVAEQQQKQADQEQADRRVERDDASSLQGAQTANQMALAVNMFAGAVQSFSGAIDVQQAWAAWAGEIGKAAGLPGSSNAALPGTNAAAGGQRGLRNYNPGNIEYGAFAKAHGATGSDGRFAVFPTMEAGTAAHEALLSSDYLAKGFNTPSKIIGKYAPASENNQAAYLKFLASKGFAPDATINAGNLPAFAAAQRAYESGYGSSKGIGESRAKMQTMQVQRAVADYLGVPVQQIQQGGVSRGDASWASGQIQSGISNNIFGIQRKLSTGGVSRAEYAKLQQELVTQTRGLDMMKQYSGDVVDRQTPGERARTVGDMPVININVNGVTDPKAVGAAVNDAIRKSMTDLVNNNATGIKG